MMTYLAACRKCMWSAMAMVMNYEASRQYENLIRLVIVNGNSALFSIQTNYSPIIVHQYMDFDDQKYGSHKGSSKQVAE